MLNNILVFLSGFFMIFSVAPYLLDVVKKRTKPRIVTWLTWGTLMSIAAVTSIVEKQYSTAVLLLSSAAGSFAIVTLGMRSGDKKFEKLDIVCLVGVVVGIVLWQVFNSPSIGALAMVLIDFVGGVPTTIHAWRKPNEETWSTFLMCLLGASCTLLVTKDWIITAYAYPLFIACNSLLVTLIIIFRKKIVLKKTR